MSAHAERLLKHTATRYLAAVAAVAAALLLRMLLEPITGNGARFVLAFAAVLVVSLFVGVGPGVLTLALSVPLTAYFSVTRAGTPVSQAVIQALLYVVDGLIILYVASIVTKKRRSLDDANRELRRLTDEAAQAEAHARQVIELSPDAFFLANLEARFTDVNHAASDMLGYTREELLGKTIFEIIPAEDAQRLRDVRDQLLVPGAISKAEWTLKRKDGTAVPVDVSANILGDGRWLAFIRDMTDRKNVEEALHRAVADRNDVLRIVAHDLRNPLSTIMMEAQILETPSLVTVPRDVPASEVILRSVKRMNQLIQDLLDVALVEAGELKVEQARHSAATVAREAVDSQATIAADSKIEIRLEIEPNVRDVWCACDHKRLLQVFENLIGNAIKFTEAGGRITVRAVSQERDVLFSVADTGCGIEADSLAHVFDRFWQASTHARHMGAGLGLPVAKGIVEAHGGRMWVESVPGRGSTFYFTIPKS